MKISPRDRAQADAMAFKHIKTIFLRALHRFGGDRALWHSYLDFGTAAGFRKALSTAFSRALQLHPKDPSFWLKAAHWEYETNSNIIAARSLLQRGIRFLPQDRELRLRFFQMEILYLKNVKQSLHAAPDTLGAIQLPEDAGEIGFDRTPFMQGAIPLAILDNSLNTLPSGDFALAMLDVYHDCRHEQADLEQRILTHLLSHERASDPTVWAGLAKRAGRLARANLEQALTGIGQKLQIKKGVTLAGALWEAACVHIASAEIWWLRAQAFPQQVEKFGAEMRRLRIQPTREFYRAWLEALQAQGSPSVASVLQEALGHYPDHLAFVELELEARGSLDYAEAHQILSRHSAAGPEFRTALAQVVLGRVRLAADFVRLLKEVLVASLKSEKASYGYSIKEWAARWVANWSPDDRRPVYQHLLGLSGTPASLFVLIANNERKGDPAYARTLFQQALRQHQHDQALWEEAISFEYQQGNVTGACLLFQRGRVALPNPDDFVAQHSLRWKQAPT